VAATGSPVFQREPGARFYSQYQAGPAFTAGRDGRVRGATAHSHRAAQWLAITPSHHTMACDIGGGGIDSAGFQTIGNSGLGEIEPVRRLSISGVIPAKARIQHSACVYFRYSCDAASFFSAESDETAPVRLPTLMRHRPA
jgi:hypothetical protein